MVNTVR